MTDVVLHSSPVLLRGQNLNPVFEMLSTYGNGKKGSLLRTGNIYVKQFIYEENLSLRFFYSVGSLLSRLLRPFREHEGVLLARNFPELLRLPTLGEERNCNYSDLFHFEAIEDLEHILCNLTIMRLFLISSEN